MNEFYVLDVLKTSSSLTRSFLTLRNICCDTKIEVTCHKLKTAEMETSASIKYNS